MASDTVNKFSGRYPVSSSEGQTVLKQIGGTDCGISYSTFV